MKNVIPQKLILTVLLSVIFSVGYIYAQDPGTETLSKDELKLKKLEDKVAALELKIADTEAKIAQADSLVDAGFEMANEAENEIKVISGEEKAFLKENDTQRKNLLKQMKKADDDEAKSIEGELKTLEAAYKTETKSFEKRYAAEEKKIEKAKSNDAKGKEKLKQLNPKLKELQKSLELAEEELANFKAEKEL